jgi:hypothetical protein
VSAFTGWREPGFWLVLTLLIGVAVLAGRPFLPPRWRTPILVVYWAFLPYLALIAGAVSPRLMGLIYLDWLTTLRLGLGLAAVLVAAALGGRLLLQRNLPGTAEEEPAAHVTWAALGLGILLAGGEEFFWCFLRGSVAEVLWQQPAAFPLPEYVAVWVAALLALPFALVVQPSWSLRLVQTAILIATSVLFFYTRNFWLCWFVHAALWLILAPAGIERAPTPQP